MRIRDAWKKWQYLGYDAETLASHRLEADRSNLHTLKHICLLGIALTLCISVVFGPVLHDYKNMTVSLGAFAFLIAVFFYVRSLLGCGQREKLKYANALVLLVSIVAYALSIYVGVMGQTRELAVMAVWMFLLVQISFHLPPLQNALTVLTNLALFFILTGWLKPAPEKYYDMLYAGMSVVAGLLISHHQTRTAMDNIIAKNCLTQANFALYHTCTTDELTGLSNRRMLFEKYDAVERSCADCGCSLACIVLDIDDYKQYNDAFGHPEGDALLRGIGAALHAYGEENNIEIGRIGGEEFLAVWMEKDASRAERVAEELRAAVARMRIPHASTADHRFVSMSAGFCVLPPALAKRAYFFADKALYRAKDAGKNRSCRFEPSTGAYVLTGA